MTKVFAEFEKRVAPNVDVWTTYDFYAFDLDNHEHKKRFAQDANVAIRNNSRVSTQLAHTDSDITIDMK